ncbi:MAG: hypothetical protein B6U97_01910 [Candidatus Altiarchaeales archaeon ex4484_96]|nr:MAG: hypothetical protein B6U97_01910 [Candidatus Altiarchaeales archaeon ex4484_96]
MEDKTPIFWGCTITHNYPYLMEATRKALEALGTKLDEYKDFSCCPDPVYVKAYDKKAQLALSARNLSLPRNKQKNKLLVVCNGCYNILHEANAELKDNKRRQEINGLLPEENKYDGNLRVEHALQEIYSSLPLLKTKVKKPLKGLQVAVHYGCHALYPAAVSEDNPENPASMDEIVRALGAESIEYETNWTAAEHRLQYTASRKPTIY